MLQKQNYTSKTSHLRQHLDVVRKFGFKIEGMRDIRRGTEEISETTSRFNEACQGNASVCEKVQVQHS
jgi:hypothetical protein